MPRLLTLLALAAPLLTTPTAATSGGAVPQAEPTTDCATAVAGCVVCRFSAPGVTPRVVVCLSCATGFALRQNGTACCESRTRQGWRLVSLGPMPCFGFAP